MTRIGCCAIVFLMKDSLIKTIDPRAQSVLDYWFGDLNLTDRYFKERSSLWFMGGPKVDIEIRRKFGVLLDLAVRGQLREWQKTPKGCLALIILLDQFSLNLYREKPASYIQSSQAIPIANRMIQSGMAWTLTPAEMVFVYLPLEHSEKLSDQVKSVALFRDLAKGAPKAYRKATDEFLDYAIRHFRVVKRFGRFPDRNAVFGRASTPAEVKFLASDQAPF